MRPALCGTATALLLLLVPCLGSAQEVQDPPGIHRVPIDRLHLPSRSTTEVLGYPAVTADVKAVEAMLREARFEELDRYLAGLQDATRQRVQLEYDLVAAVSAFGNPDSSIGAAIDSWVGLAPASSSARAARAEWHLAKAWQARGTGYANTVSSSAAEEMERHLRLSVQDAQAAIQLDSASFDAYTSLLDALLLAGDRTASGAAFEAGRRFYPGSHYLAHQYLIRLEPRWGGSLEEMNAFATQVAADSLLNPRLRTFLGSADAYRASMEVEDDPAMALRHANAALRYGPEFYFLLDRGHAYTHLGDYARAVNDLDAALAQRPQNVDALQYHAEAVSLSADYARGNERQLALKQVMQDFTLVLSLRPADSFARKGLERTTYELRTCPDYEPECGGSQYGALSVARSIWRDLSWWLAYIGVGGFLSWWAFVRWARNGFYLPRYVHLIALLALLTICYLQYLWVQAGAPMTLRRWFVIPVFPGLVYVLFIGLGGAQHARVMAAKALRGPDTRQVRK